MARRDIVMKDLDHTSATPETRLTIYYLAETRPCNRMSDV